MNIRNWSLGQVMQLPDYLFGSRYIVSLCVSAAQGATAWDISEVALPERFVLWSFGTWTSTQSTKLLSWRLAMGDQLPTAAGMMSALEPLVNGLGYQGAGPRSIYGDIEPTSYGRNMRQGIIASGRRLVLEVTAEEGNNVLFNLDAVISAVPTELPEWFLKR